jgi:protocatechuate 3,4-dioxygenase beta subunit
MRHAVPMAILLFLASIGGLAQQSAGSGQATVEGTVVNAINSRQVPRAGVLLFNVQKNNDATWIRADDNGRFHFKNISAGTYRITADRQGFFTDARKRAFQTIIDVSPRGEVKNVLVRLLPLAVISGRIVDDKNDPVQNVEMKLFSWEYLRGRRALSIKGSTLTDDRGEYRISGVRPGNYFLMANYDFRKQWIRTMGNLSATTRPDVAYLPQFFPGTTDFREAQQIAAKPGDEIQQDFAFFTQPAVSIRGRVVNGLSGRPVPKAAVTASWAQIPAGVDSFSDQTDENGIFEIWGLAPGSYTLQTSFPDQGATYTGEERVEVGSAGVPDAQIAALPDFDVNGKVRIEGSQSPSIQQVSIEFMTVGSKSFNVFRSAAAKPDFRLTGKLHLETHYRVNAINLADDYYLKSVTVSGREMPKNDVVVGGRQSEVELIISPLGGHIEGTVVDSKNQPVNSSYLMLAPDVATIDPDQMLRTRSDAKGKFVLRGVPPGTYKLVAFEDVDLNELIAQPEVLKRYIDQGEALKVAEGGKYDYVTPKFIPADAGP